MGEKFHPNRKFAIFSTLGTYYIPKLFPDPDEIENYSHYGG